MKEHEVNPIEVRASSRSGRQRPAVEWPTVAVAVAVYTGYFALTWNFHRLAPWVAVLAGGTLLAWYGSLCHEVIHAHPTPWRWLNEALVALPLWLWFPLSFYRESHLQHHQDVHLTDPVLDPETWFLTPQSQSLLPIWVRRLLEFTNTLAGRLVVGPWVVLWRLARSEATRIANREPGRLRAWALHLLACVPVLWWVMGVCGIPFLEYWILMVWPGISLTLLRSFVEHRAAEAIGARTAIVESGLPFSLLFLNNNLHAVHHAMPALAWYRLPGVWRAARAQVLEANGGYRFAGYGEVARRFLFRPCQPLVHPRLGQAPRSDPPPDRPAAQMA